MNCENFKKKLSSAACLLLGSVPLAQAEEIDKWNIDTSILHYKEGGGRVQAIEPEVELDKKFNDGREENLKFTIDVLTGATPTGATATNVPQTFTRPSGKHSYTVPAGVTPLDDTFHDRRLAVNGSWKQPLNKLLLATFGASLSTEYDFRSIGLNAQIARDLNQKNTTLIFGLSTEADQVNPVGGAPIPFAVPAAAGAAQPREGSHKAKSVLDGLIGVTQIVNRRTLMQFNYSLSHESGYLNDPYKFLSRINPATGSTDDYVYENRPGSRTKNAFYWLTRTSLNRDVISASYRYFFDDWGIKSQTLDVNYNWKFSEKQYLEPRFRIYSQSAADFYHVNLLSGEALPQNASADYRLAKFNGFTYGLKWGMHLRDNSEVMVRIEYYMQVGDSNPGSAIGVQKGLDLYPGLKATIAQVEYKF